MNVTLQRLANERLIGRPFSSPEEVVGWLCAVQSQDYAGACWSVAMRCGGSERSVDEACNTGRILRTHVLRPTWHFVLPEDIRWLLALTGPRVSATNARIDRQVGLDAAVLEQSNRLIEKALGKGAALTRDELAVILGKNGIPAAGVRLAYLLMHAELSALVCSGPRKGKQFTYVLLDSRAPQSPRVPGDEALMTLTRRYFESHGPATPRDFSWWSGLTLTDAKRGLASLGNQVASETVEGTEFFFLRDAPSPPRSSKLRAHLLPAYDEYLVAFQERSVAFGPGVFGSLDPVRNPLGRNLVAIDGRVLGGWRRTLTRAALTVEVRPFRKLTPREQLAIQAEVDAYGRFAEREATLEFV